jgi:hypothetical protein
VEGEGYLSVDAKEELKSLEANRRKLLEEKDAMWRQKRREIWLEKGDENTNFFQPYAKGRKSTNTIWQLQSQTSNMVSSFEGITQMGKYHFKNIFKADPAINIVDFIRITLYFPRFVNEDENMDLYDEVTENELKESLQIFQRDKSPVLYG